jgi:nucleoside 2-deoxyribosyltransferase
MKFYLGIKFHEDLSNKQLIERICFIAEQQNHKIICVHRDLEKWGNVTFSLEKLMQKTFEIIEDSDAVIIELSENGVGLGIEAGYAVAKSIPVYALLPKGSVLSPTMEGICKKCFQYETDADIEYVFESISTMSKDIEKD